MELAINYWAVILATLSTMIVGSIWYTPKVFGTRSLIGSRPFCLWPPVPPLPSYHGGRPCLS